MSRSTLVIFGIVAAIRWLVRQGGEDRGDRALEILRERYARGEISKRARFGDELRQRLLLEAEEMAALRGFESLLSLDHVRGIDRLGYQRDACYRVLREMRGRGLLADEVGLPARREAMFRGEPINVTEGRAVLVVPGKCLNGDANLDDLQTIKQILPERAFLERFFERLVGRGHDTRVGGRLVEDVAWSYPEPLPEAIPVEGMVCFFHERVDAVFVDDRPIAAPGTG